MILSYWSSRSKQPCYELPIEIDGSMAGHCCKPLGPVSDSANSQQNSKVLNHRAGKESACNSFFNARNLGLIPGLGRSPGEGKGNPLQYSGLENSMDYIVHGVAKSQTRLSNFYFTAYTSLHAFNHHYSISNFTALKIFCTVFLPFSPLTPGHQWSVYGFHSFTFPECYIVGLILGYEYESHKKSM